MDLAALTQRQKSAWATGDFHRIGVAQLVVGERLVRSLHVHAGEKVLDVAGGSGNTALAGARRWADVTCTDYVPDLLEHARVRADAEGLPMKFEVADAQQLPFADGAFDVVTSTFGAMFAPDQQRTADEMLRVLRPGGRLGMANWLPDSFPAALFAVGTAFVPPPPGLTPATAWGTQSRLEELFGDRVCDMQLTRRSTDMVHASTTSLFALFRDWFGPVAALRKQLDNAQFEAYSGQWIAAADRFNAATDGTCDIPCTYLEVVATKV